MGIGAAIFFRWPSLLWAATDWRGTGRMTVEEIINVDFTSRECWNSPPRTVGKIGYELGRGVVSSLTHDAGGERATAPPSASSPSRGTAETGWRKRCYLKRAPTGDCTIEHGQLAESGEGYFGRDGSQARRVRFSSARCSRSCTSAPLPAAPGRSSCAIWRKPQLWEQPGRNPQGSLHG